MSGILEMSAGELEGLAQSGVEPHRRMVTAKALLALADGASVQPVRTVKAQGSHEDTVRRWRNHVPRMAPRHGLPGRWPPATGWARLSIPPDLGGFV